MSDLPEQLKSAVPTPDQPDVDSLWNRGQQAARRRTQAMAIGGLAVAVLLTVGVLRLTTSDDASPLDTVDTPDSIPAVDGDPDNEPPEIQGDVFIDGPIGSIVHLYPVGLPDDWTVTIHPATWMSPQESVTVQPVSDGEPSGPGFSLTFEPGDPGALRWTNDLEDPALAFTQWRDWSGGGWTGRVGVSSDDDLATRLDLIASFIAAGLLDDPAAEPPPGWRVEWDSRSWTRGSQIEVAPPDARTITMTHTESAAGSYTRAAVDAQMAENHQAAIELELDLTAGGLPGWDAGLGFIFLYEDGLHYEIQMPEDMSETDRQLFLNSLQPVNVVERSNPELLALEGPGPTRSDHWHAAYGIFACDRFLDPFETQNDPNGIHSHADGVVHIHPFDASVEGSNATFGAFLDAMEWNFEPGNIGARDGSVRFDENACGDGVETTITLFYRPGSDRTANPLRFEGDEMFDAYFPSDSGSWILAQIPASGSVGLLPEDRIEQLELAGG